MKSFNILRYGIMKYTRKGVRLSLVLTYRCNLKCDYPCSMVIAAGKWPESKESTLEQWQKFVNDFPYQVREIQISGGSPELHPDFVELTNWLLDQGYFVQIMTNLLFPEKLGKLKRTPRLMLCATYHHSSNLRLWMRSYDYLSKHYRIATDELETRLTPPRVKIRIVKSILDINELKTNKLMIRVSPDLKMFNTCYGVYKRTNK